MLIRIAVLAILSVFNIVFFKEIENFFLSVGTSWTISKIIPYLMLAVLGALLSYSFTKTGWFKNKTVENIVTVFIFALPFAVGFILHPIYQGDFSNGGSVPVIKKQLPDFDQADLVILTIPGCPYCHESVTSSNFMVKRNPDLKIKYIVCNSDPKEIEPYRSKLDKKIDVVIASDPNELAKVAEGRFPTFMQLDGKKVIQRWSNNEFGVRAKDILESKN